MLTLADDVLHLFIGRLLSVNLDALCCLHYFQKRGFCLSSFHWRLRLLSICYNCQITIMHMWHCRSLNLSCENRFRCLVADLHWVISIPSFGKCCKIADDAADLNWVLFHLPRGRLSSRGASFFPLGFDAPSPQRFCLMHPLGKAIEQRCDEHMNLFSAYVCPSTLLVFPSLACTGIMLLLVNCTWR